MRSEYTKLSTARKLTAHLLAASGIPEAVKIAQRAQTDLVYKKVLAGYGGSADFLAPVIEQEFRAVLALTERFPEIPNIIELGAGYSPLGLILTRNGMKTFVDSDIPEISEEKWNIILEILGGTPRPNLIHVPIDILSKSAFTEAERQLQSGPVMVVSSGLISRFTRGMKAKAAHHILELLQRRGGVWITTDLAAAQHLNVVQQLDPRGLTLIAKISQLSARDFRTYPFPTNTEAEEFFRLIGFVPDRYCQRELVDKVHSHATVHGDQKTIANILCNSGKVWALTAR